MLTLLWVLFSIFGLVSFVTWFFVLIAAFKDEVWKGLLCFICGFYALYYSVTENDLIVVKDIPVGIIFAISTVVAWILSYFIRSIH